MPEFLFVPATKAGSFARIALIGPSGGGKTFTALTLAKAFGGTAGVIDSERGSAAKYSDVFRFHHLTMTTFAPDMLTGALAAAAEQGIGTVIIDSWSHYWEGVDGMLEQVDRAAARTGRNNSFEGWKEMRPTERRMLDAIIGYPGHVIVTLRVKTDYVPELDARGKMSPKKVGLKPVQRDGLEYEFDLVADMADDGRFVVSKSRCPALSGAVIDKPTEDVGYQIDTWLKADAVGEPLNPLTIRDWVLDDARTMDELRAKRDEVAANPAIAGAPVRDLDGGAVGLTELIVATARRLRDRTGNTDGRVNGTRRELAGATA